ncbi:MAG: amidinotransferase [Frankiales bacterium]|nr:amidinotransferase [Frankiales bacterium]
MRNVAPLSAAPGLPSVGRGAVRPCPRPPEPAMTLLDVAPPRERVARPRHFLMCRPEHFDVTYAINPWMDPARPVDRALALRQWDALTRVYEALGHRVDVLPGVVGLPDMVFAANDAGVHGGRALGARFTFRSGPPRRRPTRRGCAPPASTSPSRCTSTRGRATSWSSATSCRRAPGTAPTPARTPRRLRSSGSRSSRSTWSTRATTTWTPASRPSVTPTSLTTRGRSAPRGAARAVPGRRRASATRGCSGSTWSPTAGTC